MNQNMAMHLAHHLCVVTVSMMLFLGGVDAQERQAVMAESHAKIFRNHCYDCHDSESEEAGINLEDISFDVSDSLENAELWQKILNSINSGEMPPEDSKPLSDADKTAFLKDLTAQMVTARKLMADTGGIIPLRRLNRREYSNTIQALLAVSPDVSSLPDDQAGSGYDTHGGSLFFSSDQLESYQAAAQKALKLCLFPGPVQPSQTVRIEPEDEFRNRYQDYLNTITDSYDRAVQWQSQSEKRPSEFGILDEYSIGKKLSAYRRYSSQLKWYLDRPESRTGMISITTIKAGGSPKIKLPPMKWNAPGKYTVRFRAAHYPEAEERFHYAELSSMSQNERRHHAWKKVTGTLEDPEILCFEYDHLPGEQKALAVGIRTHQDRGDKNLWQIHQSENGIGTIPGLWIDWVEITGPIPDDASAIAARSILLGGQGQQDEIEYATSVIEQFARRAFRNRTPEPKYLSQLVEHYQAERQAGESVKAALIIPLSIVLASPEFLYMVETGTKDEPDRLSDSELAVRLSYLLWSSQPDEELLQLASSNQLSQADVLKQQVDRLLKDPRHDRFVHDFVHQWLQMDRLGMFQFNGAEYPTFDNAARESCREEVFQTFSHVMNSGLPLGTLLNADFVVINDVLAGYYGLPGVEGAEFRRVDVPTGSPRGGLLGTAAVMAMGSDGLRSSPVERGAWVLRHLLHDPPAPAPPNVPQLSRLDGEVLSARELQKAHQEQPQCAQCHRKIDQIGYGLENFSADGLWRDVEAIGVGKRKNGRFTRFEKFDIEPNGRLPGGQSFNDYFELRNAVGEYQSAFSRGFTEALISYGLGREFGFSDEDLADTIIQAAEQNNFQVHAFIHALIQSDTFQSR